MSRPEITDFLARPALMNALVLAVSVTALGAALTAEHAFGLHPCVLCIYQRVPFVLTALLALAGVIMARRNKLKPAALMLFLAALAFAAGAAIAFYHAGVEQHWWVSFLEGCKISFDNGGSLLAQIEAAPAARCDEIPWRDPLFGLSMAAWNAAASFIMFVLSLAASILVTRRANGF